MGNNGGDLEVEGSGFVVALMVGIVLDSCCVCFCFMVCGSDFLGLIQKRDRGREREDRRGRKKRNRLRTLQVVFGTLLAMTLLN